jgi:hypothetical protein
MGVNLSARTPAAPAHGANIVWQKDGAGNVSAYTTAAVELTGNGFDATGQTADIATTDLITTPTEGWYRVSICIIVTTVDGASSTLPSIVLTWNDPDGVAQSQTFTASSPTGNTQQTFDSDDAFISVGASAPLSFSTSGYASGTPATMQFAIHITCERF